MTDNGFESEMDRQINELIEKARAKAEGILRQTGLMTGTGDAVEMTVGEATIAMHAHLIIAGMLLADVLKGTVPNVSTDECAEVGSDLYWKFVKAMSVETSKLVVKGITRSN